MKQLFLILFIVSSVSLNILGQGYVISGEISGADGKTVSLRQFQDRQPVEVGTTTVQAGKFAFRGTTPYPEFCLLYIGEWGPVQFFIENSNIHIFADMENPEKTKVTGSKENDVYMEFMGGLEYFAQQQKQLSDSYTALMTSSIAAPDAAMNIRAQLEKMTVDRNAFMINFVQGNSGKVSTAFIVQNIPLTQLLDVAQLERTTIGLDAVSEQSPWVVMLKEQVAAIKRTAIGQPFLDITLKTPDDQAISISDYAGKGKYVLLDFWAAWCGPCRNANPRIVELYDRYKDKGFEIVGISLDQSKDAWVKAISDDKLTWPQMSDLNFWQSAAAKLYSVSAIPHMILLGKDGNIIAKGLHTETLAAKLAEIFDN